MDKTVKLLTDLPNIGKATASDLMSIGIHSPGELANLDPLATFRALAAVMGHRHDPCVLYMLMAVHQYLNGGPAMPWWKFASEGRSLLANQAQPIQARRRRGASSP